MIFLEFDDEGPESLAGESDNIGYFCFLSAYLKILFSKYLIVFALKFLTFILSPLASFEEVVGVPSFIIFFILLKATVNHSSLWASP